MRGTKLEVQLHARISKRAAALLKERARKLGCKPSHLARLIIYRELGIVGKWPA